jgi:hypothetical protein
MPGGAAFWTWSLHTSVPASTTVSADGLPVVTTSSGSTWSCVRRPPDRELPSPEQYGPSLNLAHLRESPWRLDHGQHWGPVVGRARHLGAGALRRRAAGGAGTSARHGRRIVGKSGRPDRAWPQLGTSTGDAGAPAPAGRGGRAGGERRRLSSGRRVAGGSASRRREPERQAPTSRRVRGTRNTPHIVRRVPGQEAIRWPAASSVSTASDSRTAGTSR